MTKNCFIYPYIPASASAKALSDTLGMKRIRHKNSKFKGGKHKTVINWGCSSLPDEVMKCNVINSPEKVNLCSNKLSYYQCISGKEDSPRVPEWTTCKETASKWECLTVVRHNLRGSGGDGIELVEAGSPLPNAPLYTKYVKKVSEWRVHVIKGESILVQKKARKNAVPDDAVDWRIRNLAGGFIYATGLGNPHPDVTKQAMLAMGVAGLDFGAVDVVWNSKKEQAYVLEINTAPGLMGGTLLKYSEVFNNLLGDVK